MKQVGPGPRGHITRVIELAYWSEPATDRPDWHPGATHELVAERTVETHYGPWMMRTIDGRDLPPNQSPYDRLFYKGDGTPGTERPPVQPDEATARDTASPNEGN